MTAIRSACLWAAAWLIMYGLGVAPKFGSEEFWMLVVGIFLILIWLPPVPRNTKPKEGTS